MKRTNECHTTKVPHVKICQRPQKYVNFYTGPYWSLKRTKQNIEMGELIFSGLLYCLNDSNVGTVIIRQMGRQGPTGQ
jgi:hypothetical protein